MLVAGFVASGVVLIAESQILATVALAGALLLLPAAFVTELAGRNDPVGARRARDARIVGLFACGVLVFADNLTLAIAALGATIVLLLAIGFVDGHVQAVWWAAVFLLSALAADLLWYVEWEPFDRSDDYESLPQSPFVLIGLPVPMALVAVGVAARWLWGRLKHA
jgi:hypothetical protein